MEQQKLTEEQLRNLYLRKLQTGEIQGPLTGKASIDKPWLKTYPEQAITKDIPKQSLYEHLKSNIEDEPERVLINFLGTEITAGEILSKIDETEQLLKSKGIKKGDVVALALPNIPEAIYCIYALNKIGAIACNIDPRQSEKAIEDDIINSGAKSFIGINNTYRKIKNINKKQKMQDIIMLSPLRSAKAKSGKLKLIKTLSFLQDLSQGNYTLKKERKYGNIIKSNIESTIESKELGDDVAIIVHTGGTTGVHKGVKLTNSALNYTSYQHDYLTEPIGPGSSVYNPLPPFMAYGMSTMHLVLCHKFYMYMMPISNPNTFGDEIAELQPELIYGGPIHYQAGRKSEKLKRKGIKNTKAAVSGGEKITIAEEQKNNEYYCGLGLQDEIYNGYGTSEVCGVFAVKRGRSNSSGSVGNPLPLNNIKIIDEETQEEVEYGVDGEIYITGKSLMAGYTKQEETDLAMDGEWFRTGDIGHLNESGELFITGRKKRQFVSGVDKVYVPIIEEQIEELDMIDRCVIVGVPDDELRKVPYAYIMLSEKFRNQGFEEIIQNEIRKKLKDELPETSIPKYYEFITELKYTPNGKVDFVQMEKDALEKVTSKNITKAKRK